MAGNFEDAQLVKTLLLVKTGTGRVRINQFYKVATLDGEQYLRPLPSGVGVAGLPHVGIAFDKVEFIDEPASNKDGLYNLTHDSIFAKQRMGP